MLSLDELGSRICILGPSNSGKSTLASSISIHQRLPCIHLDQLYHQPNSNWVPRPYTDFQQLHDNAIQNERWIIDGNYTNLFPQRASKATGLILLDVSTKISLYRYFRRCLFEKNHLGALEGNQDSIKWNMIKHIAITTPKNRQRYQEIFINSSLPKIQLRSPKELEEAYRYWKISK